MVNYARQVPETGWFTYDDFADRIGDEFRIHLPDGRRIDLRLVDATVLGQPEGAPRQQFSLVFRGPSEPMLGQEIWPLEHDMLEDVALFLVAIGADADGIRYEAAFA